ncbi:MAG: J domain-containing protein [Candidatus Thermoplasmatota archaeon]|jgi:hypothetical protein|nr:J domain-containing protein [Candidatus Thermoplasmatota archaeon]MDP7264508.1 J domain-containing protein [Candidatus Thermoplasmatota archaeon]
MAKTRLPEGAKSIMAKVAVISRDAICTNCMKTIRKGDWVVECECSRKYDMDCAFDLMTCSFCGADFYDMDLSTEKEKVPIGQFLNHVDRYYERLKDSRKEPILTVPLPKVKLTSPVRTKPLPFVSAAVLGQGTTASHLQMEEYCTRAIGIQNSFITEATKARINTTTAFNSLVRARTALKVHDITNSLSFLKQADREIKNKIIHTINISSQLMKDIENEGANIRIIRNLIIMGFNSLEEGKILASLYYLRRVNEEVERMKASGDPATYFEGEDFYSLIGVEKDAEFSSMRKAYRKKISELHPDRHADSDEETRTTAEDNAKSLNRAYNTLKRSQERRLYDIAMGFCKY